MLTQQHGSPASCWCASRCVGLLPVLSRPTLLEQLNPIKKIPSLVAWCLRLLQWRAEEGVETSPPRERSHWPHGGLCAVGRAGVWPGGGGSPPLEALRGFCSSWGVLWSPLVERLPPYPCLRFQVGRFFYLRFTRSVGLAAVLYKKKMFPVANRNCIRKPVFDFSILRLSVLSEVKGFMHFFLFHLLSFKGKDSNCTIQDSRPCKIFNYSSWPAEETLGRREVERKVPA